MKRLILMGLAALVVLLVAAYGSELVGLYRLDRYVGESTRAYEANGGPWPQLADACTGCHGVNGNSDHQSYPSLAGQPAPYLAAQLQKFANGGRSSPSMSPLAMTMSTAEIDRLAAHFAKQAVVDNRSFEPDPGLREKGRQLVAVGHCTACHGARLMGQGQFPRLAGQGHDYVLAQLEAFAAGSRSDSTGAMQTIAAGASVEDRRAIANYLAGLRPQSN